MARTETHGNPNWSRDETILALALYFASEGRIPSKNAAEVVELSTLLRSLPYHRDAAKQPTFRNPEGVVFKLLNLRNQATGKGFSNVSKVDRAVWTEFKDRPDEVQELARSIRSGIAEFEELENEPPVEEFAEGRLLTALHQRRERNAQLRGRLLKKAGVGGLRCEICGLNRPYLPLPLQEAMFEAHHNVPLSSGGPRKTRLEDLSLLCASCHRLIHKLISTEARWFSVSAAKQGLGFAEPSLP